MIIFSFLINFLIINTLHASPKEIMNSYRNLDKPSPNFIGMLKHEDFVKNRDVNLKKYSEISDIIYYRLAFIAALNKDYDLVFDYLAKIKSNLIGHNIELISGLYEKIDIDNQKKITIYLQSNKFFEKNYHSVCEFYDVNNRNKRSKFMYSLLKTGVLDKENSLNILNELLKTLPEGILWADLSQVNYFNEALSKLKFEDFLYRINKLITFGANQEAHNTIEYLKSSNLTITDDQKCELVYQEAKIMRRTKKFTDAREKLKTISLTCPNDVLIKKRYLDLTIAAIQKDESSLNKFDEFVKDYPTHGFSDDILFLKAQLLFDLNKNDEAMISLDNLIKDFPKGDMIHEALFLKAFFLAKNNQTKLSIQALEKLKSISDKNSIEYSQAFYWIARLTLYPSINTFENKNSKTKEALIAIKNLRELVLLKNANIYSSLAYALLKNLGEKNILKPHWPKSKMAELLIEKDLSQEEKTIFNIIKHGFKEEAEALLKSEKLKSNDYKKAITMAHLYELMDKIESSYLELVACQGQLGNYIAEKFPVFYNNIAYPKPFKKEVQKALASYKIEENFLYALMRQESFFVVDAQSWAGALGLCQLMYSTATDFAKKNKLVIKDKSDLFNPQTNLLLGAHTLFDYTNRLKHPVLGIAAYNAGVSSVLSWQKKYNAQATDYFIEQIPYKETKNYVKKVLGNLWNYNLIYNESVEKIIELKIGPML
jgi:soluble lytic murein transglycosylase